MFEKYLIVDGSLRNTDDGVAVDLRIPYYRGLGLSMVEYVDLAVDGDAFDPKDTTFAVHGNEYPVAGTGEITDDRWGFHEPATITVHDGRRLAPGEHDVSVSLLLRVSYLPVQQPTRASKKLTV